MKLNLTKEQVIEQLEKVLSSAVIFNYDKAGGFNFCRQCHSKLSEPHKSWCDIGLALSVVAAWRKERGGNRVSL